MRSILFAFVAVCLPGLTVSSAGAQDVIDPRDKPSFGDRLAKMTPAQRDAEIARNFAEFDRNTDGQITVDEAPRVPPMKPVVQPGASIVIAQPSEADAKFFISLYDSDEDEKVSLAEYRARAALTLRGKDQASN